MSLNLFGPWPKCLFLDLVSGWAFNEQGTRISNGDYLFYCRCPLSSLCAARRRVASVSKKGKSVESISTTAKSHSIPYIPTYSNSMSKRDKKTVSHKVFIVMCWFLENIAECTIFRPYSYAESTHAPPSRGWTPPIDRGPSQRWAKTTLKNRLLLLSFWRIFCSVNLCRRPSWTHDQTLVPGRKISMDSGVCSRYTIQLNHCCGSRSRLYPHSIM